MTGPTDPATNDLREKLAAIEHERWAHWQRYMHSQCYPAATAGSPGSLVIPGELVNRWERQIATAYADLSEPEKNSDREQVDRYLSIVVDAVRTQVAAEIRARTAKVLDQAEALAPAPAGSGDDHPVAMALEWAARIAEGNQP